jgi:WD40 repeat protein
MSEISILKEYNDNNEINSVAIHATIYLLAIGSGNNAVKIWNLESNKSTPTQALHNNRSVVNSVAFHPTEPIFASGSSDNTAKVCTLFSDYSPYSNARCSLNLKHSGSVNSVAFHPTKLRFLATGSSDKTAKVWWLYDNGLSLTGDGTPVTLTGHTSSVNSVAFHPIEFILATGSSDMTVKLWQINTEPERAWKYVASCVATLEGHTGIVNSVTFHPTKPFLATGSSDETVKLWQLSSEPFSATCIATLNVECGNVNSVAFHPSELILAIGGGDNTVKLWQVNSDGTNLTNIAILAEHKGPVSSVAFSPDASLLATGSWDKKTILWELKLKQNSRPNIHKQNAGSLQNESRFFKLVRINGKEVDGGRYELPSKTKSGKEQTRGPKDKASIAFSEICKKNNKKGECSYKFAIQETTRGSNKKVYHYEGKRVKLTKPIVLELKDKKVVIKYKNVITPIQ